jgi:hypothetical protein
MATETLYRAAICRARRYAGDAGGGCAMLGMFVVCAVFADKTFANMQKNQ